jgi:hypothetical protein
LEGCVPLYGLAARIGVTAAKEYETSMQLPSTNSGGRRRILQVLRIGFGAVRYGAKAGGRGFYRFFAKGFPS